MIVWDIETGPRPESELRAIVDPFDPAKVKGLVTGEFDPATVRGVVTGEFDQASVKLGALKDEAKIKEKIDKARADHAAAVAESQRLVETARAEFEAAKGRNGEVLAQAEADYWSNVIDRAALSPTTGQVLAIGYHNTFGDQTTVNGCDRPDKEPDVLKSFWMIYRKCREKNKPLVGFNIFGFDLPFLVKRSWLLGVDVPGTLFDPTGRYFDRVFVDLLARWKCGNYSESIKLDSMAKFFGVGGKPDGICGGDFARLWRDERDTAIEYLVNDLKMTADCAARMGF